VVISDFQRGNFGSKALIIQDGTAGIFISCSSTHNYQVGDSVVVSGCSPGLAVVKGQIQLNGINPNSNIIKQGVVVPSVRNATLAEINANFTDWESTLVRVQFAVFPSAGGTYSSSPTITDGSTGSIKLYTVGGASFASSTYPSTASVTGVLQIFNTTQEILMRTIDDVR
jgi:hypothetical protein